MITPISFPDRWLDFGADLLKALLKDLDDISTKPAFEAAGVRATAVSLGVSMTSAEQFYLKLQGTTHVALMRVEGPVQAGDPLTSNPAGIAELAHLFYMLEEFEQSAHGFEQAIKAGFQGPDLAKVYQSLGLARYRLAGAVGPSLEDIAKARAESLSMAMSAFDTAIDLDPTMKEGWFNRALARKLQGDEAGALADAQQALRLDPTYQHALVLESDLVSLRHEPS